MLEPGAKALDLPDHGLKTKQGPAGAEVFDHIRRKWVVLTPEEWVRQHFIDHLVQDLGCPASLIAVEKPLVLNELAKRADIVVHGTDGRPVGLVECKAPTVRIDQRTLEQAARYNIVFRVGHLIVTNGYHHYSFRIDHKHGKAIPLARIPTYKEMSGR